MFNVKVPVPVKLRSRVFVQNVMLVKLAKPAATSRRILREQLTRDRASHIFQHLHEFEECRKSCSTVCFSIILDHGITKFQRRISQKIPAHSLGKNPS